MIGYIYSLNYKDTGNPFYIGKSINPNLRFLNHNTCVKNGSSKMHFFLLENNLDFDYTIIDEIEIKENDSELIRLERYWIEQFRQWGFILLNTIHYKHPSGYYDDPVSIRLGELKIPLQEAAKRMGKTLNGLIVDLLKKSDIMKEYYRQQKLISKN